jgi:3-methyladenine DNA glycosylase AlkD
MDEHIAKVRKELISSSDEKVREGSVRYFREQINPHGVKSSEVGRICRDNFKALKGKSKTEVFRLCDELWKSGYLEETFIACEWSYNMHKLFVPDDFKTFERWVDNYVNNWASCDTFCNHNVGEFIEMYPEFLADLKRWAHSENRWKKRASAVSLIVPGKRGKFLDDIFEIADILLTDRDDMVQKGYGWMLKVASQAHQQEVFGFIMKRKAVMPRTALRYAIEKMPPEMKKRAMEK